MAARILFIGVSTGQSLVNAVWPGWRDELGAEVELQGVDLPLPTPPAKARALVEAMRDEPHVIGAVITSHKLGFFAAAHDLCTELDVYARLLRELNGLAHDGSRLRGLARDPLAVEHVLDRMLAPGWGEHEEALCFGAGGAGSAIVLSLLYRLDRETLKPKENAPGRVSVVDVSRERLAALQAVVAALPRPRGRLRLACHHEPRDNDALLAELPARSLVINATGLGKDAPGSPLTDHARFPDEAVAWDANYRGDLGFLRQAREQHEQRGVRVHDGWEYFLHGWTQTLAPILRLSATSELFGRLADAAQPWRPAVTTAAGPQ
jgi:shikimate 5-dehydrogenase